MPVNEDFALRILIGGTVVEEYQLDGLTYIECNLNTPVSYKQSMTELVGGDLETQEFPVTPYEIEVDSLPNTNTTFYYRIFVDGIKVKGLSLSPGDKRRIKGFRDGSVIRELLFSMPRYAKDERDRLSHERLNKVGQIEVECWEAELKTTEWRQRNKQLDFTQANKKDSSGVTHGQYMMATSRAGRAVCPRKVFRCVDSWKRKTLKSSLLLYYRMGHELTEMGFTLLPLKIHTNKTLDSLNNTGLSPRRNFDDGEDCKLTKFEHLNFVKVEQSNAIIPASQKNEPICIDLTCDDGFNELNSEETPSSIAVSEFSDGTNNTSEH